MAVTKHSRTCYKTPFCLVLQRRRRAARPPISVAWGGLRGGLSLALAVSLPDSPWKPLMLNMTFAVVVFSVIVQGLTLQRMFTQERLAGLLR